MVTEDKDALYAGAQKQVSFYARVPYYSQMFQDAGFPEASTADFSNRMADAIVVNGSAVTVKDRLLTLQAEYGVGELLAMPILEGPEVLHVETRVKELLGVRAVLDAQRDVVVAVRIGATDLCGLLGLRRSLDETIYDLAPVSYTHLTLPTIYSV